MTRPIAPEDLFRFRFVVAADLSPDATRVVFAQTRIAPGRGRRRRRGRAHRPASPRRRERQRPSADVQRLDELGAGDLSRRVDGGVHVDADGEAAALAAPARRRRAAPADGSPAGRRRRRRLVARRDQDRVHRRPAGRAAQARAPLSRRPERCGASTRSGCSTTPSRTSTSSTSTDDAAEPRRLTEDRFMNSQPKWSADGQSLVYVASHDPDSHEFVSRLRRVDLEGTVTDLTEPDGLVASHAPLSDGRIVYVVDFERDKVIGTRSSLYVLDPATGTRTTPRRGHRGSHRGRHPARQPRLEAGRRAAAPHRRRSRRRCEGADRRRGRARARWRSTATSRTRSWPAALEPAPRSRRGAGASSSARSGSPSRQTSTSLDLDTGEERRLTRLNDDVLVGARRCRPSSR